MKKSLAIALACVCLSSQIQAEPSNIKPDSLTPWATPQYFSDFKNERFNRPPFVEVVEKGKVFKKGDEGEAVGRLQEALIDLGFALPAGADKKYGGQTVAAVSAFQQSRSLPVTGKVDRATIEALDQVAPQPGKKIWEDAASASQAAPSVPYLGGKTARILIDLSEHRLFVFEAGGSLERVFPVATGAPETPTDPGTKIVYEKLADPSALAAKLWPESKGKAFGKRLIDFSWYNPETKTSTVSDEELHGTYVLDSLGQNASHGCVRMHNDAIEWMYQNIQVGDLVVIQE